MLKGNNTLPGKCVIVKHKHTFPISFDITHLHTLLYTNLQPEKYCICNFTDKQPTNILTVMFYCQRIC